MTAPAITVTLDDKRKRLGMWWQKMQHAVGGVPLLMAGVARLQAPGGGGDLLAIAEIVVAAVLLVLLARDLRSEAVTTFRAREHGAPRTHGHVHEGPDWFDIVAGALLIIEAGHAVHPGGKPIYAHPNFLLGIATATIGLLHANIARLSWKRREIRLDDDGIRARLSRFRSFSIPWSDVRGIRIDPTSIAVDTATRSHTIPLRRYRNAGEIRAAFEQWQAARSLPPEP
jgi:hypothetical protein